MSGNEINNRIRELTGRQLTSTVNADLLIVLLKGGKILTSLGEFTLLHTLTNVPVDKGTLGVEKVEFVIKTRPGIGDGGSANEK